MKKSNKGLLYLKAILVLTAVMVFLCGCVKVEIVPNQGEVVLELGSELSENVTDYVTVTPQKKISEVSLDVSGVDVTKTGTYEACVWYQEESVPFNVKVVDTTAPELFLAVDKFAKEADLTIPFDILCETLGVSVNDLTDVTLNLEITEGAATVTVDKSIYLVDKGESKFLLTATDESGNASTAEFTLIATEATYPEFVEDYSLGFFMTLNDDSDMKDSIFAKDQKDGDLEVVVDEGNLDRSVEGEYIITAKASDSDGREISVDVLMRVLDMSYIDTEDKVMFFAILVDTDDMEDIKDSLWSKELAKKYGVPMEYVKGYKPPKPQAPAQQPQNPQPPAEQPTQDTPQPTETQAPQAPVPVEDGYRDDLAQQMFAKVNEYRVQNGVAELPWDSSLAESAKIRAKETVVNFSHTRPDGSDCLTILDKAHGENIVMTNAKNAVDECFKWWINSDGHRDNILTDFYSFAGMGCYYQNGYYYFTQLFGY